MADNFAELARKAYDDNKYQEAIELYLKAIAASPEVGRLHANLAGVYCTVDDHANCILECRRALELAATEPRIYGLLANSLRKTKLNAECLSVLKEAVGKHPNDKKLQAMLKDCLEVETAANPDRYVELMFEKFCEHPKLREYLKDESFLTKLEMLVRNPQLANQLAKTDRRVLEAYDAMMLSEDI
jgi:tetratricopeptide (TPR) repeat protein